MLEDKDRIFKIFMASAVSACGSAEARRMGQDADIIKKGQPWIIEEMKNSGMRAEAVQAFRPA